MPLSPSDMSVYVATPCMSHIPLPTTVSYLETQEECLKRGIKIDIGFVACSIVHHARNALAECFLRGDHKLLFWIDSDMEWHPLHFMRALIHAQKYDCVVGIYPARSDPPHYYVRFPEESEPNDEGLIPILGTGLGFACINRRVMEKLAEDAPLLTFNGRKRKAIFRFDDLDGESRGEDYAFWADVHKAGFGVWADTQADIGHVGNKIYRIKIGDKDGTS